MQYCPIRLLFVHLNSLILFITVTCNAKHLTVTYIQIQVFQTEVPYATKVNQLLIESNPS